MERIAKWRRWEIFLEIINNKKIATKKAIDNNKKGSINKEVVILKKLNRLKINFVPQLLDHGDWFFQYNYIEWEHFIKRYQKSNKKTRNILINNLLDKILILDQEWIIHWELIKPYTNILVWKKNNIFIIDFERGKVGDFSGKNMRSFSQWLKNEWYIEIKDLKKIWKMKSIKQIYNFLKYKIMKKHYFKIVLSIIW
jgi:predicted Ser/Thr protein kinase